MNLLRAKGLPGEREVSSPMASHVTEAKMLPEISYMNLAISYPTYRGMEHGEDKIFDLPVAKQRARLL
jgi:hypothetical protein